MPKNIIETAVVGGERYTVGQRVCVVGRGTAAILHKHGTVDRFTATLMVVSLNGESRGTRRYRIGDSGLETGSANGYGGTYVHPRCQRPRPKQ